MRITLPEWFTAFKQEWISMEGHLDGLKEGG